MLNFICIDYKIVKKFDLGHAKATEKKTFF